MLRGLRHRSSTRRSYLVSSSDDDDDVVSRGRHVVSPQPGLVGQDQNNTPNSNNCSSTKGYPEQPTLQVTESRSTVSVSSSSDGSMFSSESPNLDDDDSADLPDTLAHESYLNSTIPDLEDILRSFGSKSRGTQARSSKNILDKPLFDNTDDLEDDNSNNSSYNSGFSSSSESSYESIPDTTQIAAFYSNIESSPPSVANIVTLSPSISPTSTTSDIHSFSSILWKEERVTHKVPPSRTESKRQRNERRKKSRDSKVKKNSSKATSVGNGNYNEDDDRSRQSFLSRTNSLITTSKSFGKNWSRKKRIDQFVPNLSVFEKNEKLLIVEPMNDKGSESAANGTTVAFMSDPESIILTPTSAILSSSDNVKKVVISKSKKSHVVERFDVDTGELISAMVVDLEPSKQGQNPTLPSSANQEHQVDPLALPKVKSKLDLSDTESPQKSRGSSGEPVGNHDIITANKVIENMVLLFARSDVEGIRRLLGESLESSISSLSTSSSTLSRNILFDTSIDDGIDIEDDGSDDKGGSDKQKAKHLRANKLLSLKGAYKQPSKSLQAQYLTNDYTLPLNMRGIITHYSVSILLIEPVHKVFEIVMVDVTRSMSLKETLVSARLAAADPILAEQTYVSLCSDVKVLSNMSSPVSKLVNKPTDFSTNENVRSDNKTTSDNTKQKEALMRREMERQLLVAVPLKSNFKECQMIRRVLWKNTKLQLWWSTYQNEHAVAPWSANASAAPASSKMLSRMKFPQPIAI